MLIYTVIISGWMLAIFGFDGLHRGMVAREWERKRGR